jgi:ABC-type transport system involved in multi-copper enzyme maturation permease subunit
MFVTILKKEFMENLANRRFWMALILCVLIIPLGFYMGSKEAQSRADQYQESMKFYRESHQTVADISLRGGKAFRSPSPLSFMASGVEHLFPSAVVSVGFLTYRGAQIRLLNDRSLDNPYSLLYGRLDMTFITVNILAILAMIFTFNTISGEKESRCLSQILSNSVARPTLILAKTAAPVCILSMALITGILLGAGLLILEGSPVFSDKTLFTLFLSGITATLLFIAVFIMLGLMISCLTRRAANTILLLMACWVLFAMILPRTGGILAKLLIPVKSRQVIEMEKNQLRLQAEQNMEQAISDLMNSSPNIRNQSISNFLNNLRSGNEEAQAYQEAQDRIQEENKTRLAADLEDLERHYQNKRNRQMALARHLARLSPVTCFTHILIELSHTGFLEFREWQKTRSEFTGLLNREICDRADPSLRFKNFSSSRSNVDRQAPAPVYTPRPVLLSSVFQNILPDTLLLFLYGILFFAGAHAAFIRYDVR